LIARDIRGKSAAQVARLRQGSNQFVGDSTTRIIVPLDRVGPVRPYYDWVLHSEKTGLLNMNKFLKRLEKTRRIQSI
jgi:hypothetical protein